MGRPPGNGGPAFRFTASEVAEMEGILQEHNNKLPPREFFVTLAEKFSNGPEHFAKSTVHMKQVWNWFQNKRYALKAKSSKVPVPAKLDVTPLQSLPQLLPAQAPPVLQPMPPVPPSIHGSPTSHMQPSFAPQSGNAIGNMDFEARSARDGAWYDVAAFLSVKNMDTDDPEVLVRFVGLSPVEDEWIKEAPEQALYFDAHVLDAQRMKHDSRGCRCRFLVRYDHDQSEEIVPLRKICRRPETDYRLQIYQALRDLPAQQKNLPQAESAPTTENADTIQQKMTSFLTTPAALGNPTGSLQPANPTNIPDDSATRRPEELLNQEDAVMKKARVSEEKENPETHTLDSPVKLKAKKGNDELGDLGKQVASTISMDQETVDAAAVEGWDLQVALH